MRVISMLTAAGLLLAACDPNSAPSRVAEPGSAVSPAAAPTGDFAHSQTEDISGYYRASGVTEGGLTLAQVFVGQTEDFKAWEAGQRSATFAPVMVELIRNGETLRVLPDRYAVSDGRILMQGAAPGVGAVFVDLRLDKGALATARRNLGGADDAALTGSVRFGGRNFSGVKLSWYGGD